MHPVETKRKLDILRRVGYALYNKEYILSRTTTGTISWFKYY